MQAVQATSAVPRKPLGRVDADGQEAAISMDPIKDRIENLVRLCESAKAASNDFSEAIKDTAEKSGLLASVVRKFVVAKAGEKFDDKKRECEQLSLLFDDIGG